MRNYQPAQVPTHERAYGCFVPLAMYSSRVTTPSSFVSNFSKRLFAPSGSDWRATYSASVSLPFRSWSSRSNFAARSAVAGSSAVAVLAPAGAGAVAPAVLTFFDLSPRPLPSPLKPAAGFSSASAAVRRARAATAAASFESAGTGISSNGAFFMSKSWPLWLSFQPASRTW